MAKAGRKAPIVQSTFTIIRDGDEIVARLTAKDWFIHLPQGGMRRHKHHENILLADGTNFNAAMLFAQPPVELGACRLCRRPPYEFPFREPPTHGLVRLSRAKTCVCGALCCPRHCRRCADGRIRCTRCVRLWFFRELFLWLFYARGPFA